MDMVGKQMPHSLEQWSAELRDRGALLVEQLRALREQTACVEDQLAATFERSARNHPSRADELRSLAMQARDFAQKLREKPWPRA